MFIFKAFYIHRWLSAIWALDIDELSRLCISAESHLIYVERAYIDNPLLSTRYPDLAKIRLITRYPVLGKNIDPVTTLESCMAVNDLPKPFQNEFTLLRTSRQL